MITKDIDAGLSTISRYWTRDDANVLQLAYELQDAECGVLRENKLGQIAFESRAHRPAHTAAYTFGSGGLYMWNLRQEDPLRGIYNQVDVQKRTFNVSDDSILAVIADVENSQGGTPPTIPTGSTTISIRFPGPGTPSNYIAVASWGIVDVKVNTAIDGTGTDITNSNITLARAEYADRIDVTFTSSYGSNAYAVLLRAHGTAIVESDSIPMSASDATSIARYRKRLYPNPSRWLTDAVEAQDYCDHILAICKDPHARIIFEVKANYSAAHLAAVAAIDVSDKIHIHATVATYGLGIDGDFFVEYIRHRVDSGRLHIVEYQCRAAAVHSWPASGTSYTPKVIPAGVPDDLSVASIDPTYHCLFGAEAWKYNENITGARFRAKFYAGLQADPVDLRTIAEGGTLEHDPDNGMYVVNDIYANYLGAQYEFDSGSDGFWYFAFQFTSKAGDSVWTDGNKTPRLVTDNLPTDAAGATGPPSDWWVEVYPDPGGKHAVVVKASRPKTNGEKIAAIRIQIKDGSISEFRALDEDYDPASPPLGYSPGKHATSTHYDGSAISHTVSLDARRFTRDSGQGFTGTHEDDISVIGDLILPDRRGSAWDIDYCQWGTVDTIQGLKSGYNVATATYLDVAGRFHLDSNSDMRIKVVSPPWNWEVDGYFGAEPNHGFWAKDFWSGGQHGDKTTEVFESEPIDVPSDVDLGNVIARAFFDNGYSVSDGGISGEMVGDTGNPSGASSLTMLTHDDDASIAPGFVVLQWNRDTTNYLGIYAIAVILSESVPAEGCYSAERSAHPDCVIETGTCTITKGNKSVTVTRSSNADAAGRVFCIYTNDASPDSDLDANVIATQAANSIVLTSPFNKSGTYSYAIVKRWWDVSGGDTENLAYYQFTVGQVGDLNQTAWRTMQIPVPDGTYYATVYSRNLFGIGTRLTTADAATVPGGCIALTVSGGEVDTDVSLGHIFEINSNSGYTVNNPTGPTYCGLTVLWRCRGSGNPSLDTKFRFMDGESITKTSGCDLLAAIYDSTDDKWDTFWKKASS